MDWRFFMRLKPGLSYEFEAPAHAIAVAGASSTTDTHKFHVSQETQDLLDRNRLNKDSGTVNLLLDSRVAANRLLSSDESRTLLGA
jgi:hypothetical protein